jgi:ABC-type proline/glycine betaine transport system ATPase subunit
MKYKCNIQITRVVEQTIFFTASDMDEATEIAQRIAEEMKENKVAAGSTTTNITLTDDQ